MLPLILPRSLGEERVLPALHLFRSHIFLMRGDNPLLSDWIGQLLLTFEGLGRISAQQIRRKRMKIVRNGLYWVRHDDLLCRSLGGSAVPGLGQESNAVTGIVRLSAESVNAHSKLQLVPV